jgi:hypothetical protein
MRFLVLLYDDETGAPGPEDPGWDEMMGGYMAFGDLAGEAILGGEALEPVATTRTIRHDGSSVRVTEGPFAETAECLGGYYVLEAPSLDDVIELVRHLPPVTTGGVEIRPLAQWVDAGTPAAADGSLRYLVTIHGEETEADTPGSAAWDEGAAEHGRFASEAGTAILAAGAVHPTTSASVVRIRDGELLVTDGPYAEITEVVGGFYLLQATPDTIDDLAAAVPTPPGGAVEVHPIMELG